MKQIKYSELKQKFPKLFAALEDMYYDNNGGGVKPIWYSSKAENEIKNFGERELERAELFLSQLNDEELQAFTEGDQDYCDEILIKYGGYQNAQAIMADFFDGDNCLFVQYNPFTKKEVN